MYAPLIKSARRVREHILSPNHSAVLLTDIDSGDSESPITYAHLLVVYQRGQKDPVAFISSEASAKDPEFLKELGIDDLDIAPSQGSHFLCAFVESGHQNFGGNDDWADLDKFEEAALKLVKRLGLITMS